MADKKLKGEREVPTSTAADVGAPRIVAGAAQFSGHGGLASAPRAQLLEAAMSEAVLRALADGVSIEDGETIKAYKAAARQRVKDALGG